MKLAAAPRTTVLAEGLRVGVVVHDAAAADGECLTRQA